MTVPITTPPREIKRRKPRFVGIVADAHALCVSRFHLTRVVRGELSSPKLIARYRALKASQAAPPQAPVWANRMVTASQVFVRSPATPTPNPDSQ